MKKTTRVVTKTTTELRLDAKMIINLLKSHYTISEDEDVSILVDLQYGEVIRIDEVNPLVVTWIKTTETET